MNFNARCEIHFHQQDEASVFLENASPADDAKNAEILLFLLYAVRSAYNLGSLSKLSMSLGEALSEPMMNGLDIFSNELEKSCRLVNYKGVKGRKYFIIDLNASANGDLKFNLHAKGFGFLGRGTQYYSPMSVMVLFKYLTGKRKDDSDFLLRMRGSARMVGVFIEREEIKLTMQHQYAMFFWSQLEGYSTEELEKFINDAIEEEKIRSHA